MSFHIRELDRSTWLDLVKLFEQDRMTSQCFCLSHRVTAQELVIEKDAHDQMKEWVCPAPKLRAIQPGEDNIAQETKRVHGLILYDNENPVGWVSVDPLHMLPGHDGHIEARENEWTIHCVFLLPAYRKKALSQQLIRGAMELAKKNGATIISAFPCPSETEDGQPESLLYGGRMKTYLELGFVSNLRLSDLSCRVEYRFNFFTGEYSERGNGNN